MVEVDHGKRGVRNSRRMLFAVQRQYVSHGHLSGITGADWALRAAFDEVFECRFSFSNRRSTTKVTAATAVILPDAIRLIT